MNLVEMRSKLQEDLADDTWDEDSLDRAVQRAVADITRFLPDEKIAEYTLIHAVTGESWTSADAHDTYVALANKPIKYESETVQSDDLATTYTRDTDFYMDYSNGKITTISGGSMSVTTAYKIGYTKCREAVDISALTDIVRVQRVEYPMSTSSEFDFITFVIWGTVLYIAPTQYTANKHMVVYYEAECTAPTESVDGSYPEYLDEVVLKGASAYALFSKAVEMEHAAETSIGSITSYIDDADTALDQVATLLGTGDDYINTVNVGSDVPQLYNSYATTYVNEAALRLRMADAYSTEADKNLSLAAKYFTEATERRNEFWSVLKDKSQWRKELSLMSQRQSP